MQRYVGVVGPAEATEDERALAEEVGRLLAEAGAVVVCGGLGGVMEAAAKGAATVSAAGRVRSVGLLPGDDRAAGNAFLDAVVATGLGEARNAVLASTCDALVAVGGSPGTLSETALALRRGKPVAVLAGWSVTGPDGRPVRGLHPCRTAQEAVAHVL